MDHRLVKLLLEAKGLVIQRGYRKHFYKKKAKENKIKKFVLLIRLDTSRKIFLIYKRMDYILKNKDNIVRLDSILNKTIENSKKSSFLNYLKGKYDFVKTIAKFQRMFRKYLINKHTKARNTKLMQLSKFKEKKIVAYNFTKIKQITEFMKKREDTLENTIKFLDPKINRCILRNFFLNLRNKIRKIKAITKMESVFLYNLINKYSNNKDQYMTINSLVFGDEEDTDFINNLKNDAFVSISKYVKAKIKNFLLTQFMQHSLEGGVYLLSRRIKLIFDIFWYNLYEDRYYIDFDENQDLNEQIQLNPFIKIKFRTKNYFLLNIFKIQKTFVEYYYSKKNRQYGKILERIIQRKVRQTLEFYFNKFKYLACTYLFQTDEVINKAFKVLNRNQGDFGIYLNEKEQKLKEVFLKYEQRSYFYAVDCYDHWKRITLLHPYVVKIQRAFREFNRKPTFNYLDLQDNYASWSIHLKKMRKLEEIFKSIFKRTHQMAFKWFIIKLASSSSCFGKPNSTFRKSLTITEAETVNQAGKTFRQTKENYSKYLLLNIVNYRKEKDSLILQNSLNRLRRNSKLLKLISFVIKIQRKFRAIRCQLTDNCVGKDKEILTKMYRRTFVSRLIRMLKIIKLTFYEFFMGKEYESNVLSQTEFNPVTDLVNNLKLVFAKSFFKNLFRFECMCNKLRFIQLYWKARIRLIKNAKLKEILRTFALSKMRINRRVFHNAFDKWLTNSLLLTINVAAEILTKFLFNNYVLKSRLRKFLRRIAIKKLTRSLMEFFNE